MFNQDMLDHVGIAFERSDAVTLANAFDNQKLWAAGGNKANTVERAYVKPIGHRNTITGWIVLVEKREIDCVGSEWPERS